MPASAWQTHELGLLSEKYKDTNFEEVLNSLLNAAAIHEDLAEKIPFAHDLKNWLILHPEDARSVAKTIKEESLPEDTTALLIFAIEHASMNRESQAALGDMLSDEGGFNDSVRLQAAVAVGGMEKLEDARLRDILYSRAFDIVDSLEDDFAINGSALLSLGILAKSDPAIMNKMIERLPEILTQENNPFATIAGLKALENGEIITPKFEEIARALFVSSSDENVRAASIHYIAKLGSPDEMLYYNALKDTSSIVQTTAIDVVTQRDKINSQSVSALIGLLTIPEKDEAVRAKIIVSLSPYQNDYPIIADTYKVLLQSGVPRDLSTIIEAQLREPQTKGGQK